MVPQMVKSAMKNNRAGYGILSEGVMGGEGWSINRWSR